MVYEHEVFIAGDKKMIDNILKDGVEKGLIKTYKFVQEFGT